MNNPIANQDDADKNSERDTLVQRLFRNGGFLTRQTLQDGPYWYTSNEPGPFYIYSHRVIGEEIADHLLDTITEQMKSGTEVSVMNIAREIKNCISDHQYKEVIGQLTGSGFTAGNEFSHNPISGGERKDWIFSYPIALEAGLPHFWLTKNHRCFELEEGPMSQNADQQQGRKVTHVTDIVHKGASFFDSWLPALENSELELQHIFSVFCRSEIGRTRLKKEGFPFTICEDIDLKQIRKVEAAGDISEATYDDIALFFDDRAAWMRLFIETVDENALVDQLGSRDKNRIVKFFESDPYDLKTSNKERFVQIQRKLLEALSAHAH